MQSLLICLRFNNLCVRCGCHTAAPREPGGLICRALQKLLIIIIYYYLFIPGDNLDQFKRMANWSPYRIQDNTLEALFGNGYNSITTLKSITEHDLSKIREMKIPMAQISLLRRFVKCLNCEQHPPVYSGVGGTGASMGTDVGLVPSLATSTIETIAVSHSHETNPPETQSNDSELAYGVDPSKGNSEKSNIC